MKTISKEDGQAIHELEDLFADFTLDLSRNFLKRLELDTERENLTHRGQFLISSQTELHTNMVAKYGAEFLKLEIDDS